MKKIMMIGFFTFSLLVSGCSSSDHESSEPDQEVDQMMIGDVREETSSAEVLPHFLEGKPEDMQMIYRAVATHQELLEQIPCYCGCGDSVGHKDNYDCFIHDNKEDGRVVWDDHGTKCLVCLEIAAKSVTDYMGGKSVKDIRNEIDEKYKEGYANPTPTKEI